MDDQPLSLDLTENDEPSKVPSVALFEEELNFQVGSPPVVRSKTTAANMKPTSKGKPVPSEISRTLVVMGTGKFDENLLQLWFESSENGGGPVEKVYLDKQSAIAKVIFESPDHVFKFMKQQSAVIFDQTVTFAEAGVIDDDEDEGPSRTVIVSGLGGDITEKMLSMFFASEKKSGGGDIEAIDMDEKGDMAVIRYKDPQVAKRVLEKEELKLNWRQIKLYPEIKDKWDEHTLAIYDVPAKYDTEMLQMILENEKNGGGPVLDIQMGSTCAMAKFINKLDATRLREQGEIKFGKRTFQIRQPCLKVDEMVTTSKQKTKDLKGSNENQRHSDKKKTVLLDVTNVPDGTDDQMLRLMFESQRYGGGEVKEVILNGASGTATVHFESQATIENVMEKFREKRSLFKLNGTQLKLNAVDESHIMQVKNSCAIQVQGIPDNYTDDMILHYFENHQVCEEGLVDEIYKLHDSYVISYDHPEVASRVDQIHRSSPLKIKNVPLNIKLMASNHRFKTFADDTIIQPNTLLVEDLPEDTTKDSLISYLEKETNSRIDDILFSLHTGKALVLFSNMPEWDRFYTRCCLKPFRGHMLGVSWVEKPKSIEVRNIKNCTEETLKLYFEHKSSGGGKVEHITVDTNKDNAFLTFNKYGVAEAVVRKKHRLNIDDLDVNLHYPCLGILPMGHDKSTPKKPTPDDILCHPVDKQILWFLSQGVCRGIIDQHLSTVYAKIDWVGNYVDVTDCVALKCTIPSTITDTEKAAEWQKNAQNAFWSMYKDYGKETVNVLQHAWAEFSTQIAPLVCSEHALQVTLDTYLCSVVIVGKCTDVEERCRQISQIKFAVEDAISREKESITEEIKNLPPFKLRVVQTSKVLQEINTMFPNAKVDCDIEKITIKGLPDEVQAIKLHLLDMLAKISCETVILSPGICELLSHKKSRDCIVKQLESRQICMRFEVMSRDQVVCYSRTDGDLTSGKAILKSAVQEMVIPIPFETQPIIKTKEWRRFVDKLKADNDGKLILNVDSDVRSITLVCVDNIRAKVREDIDTYLNENTVLQCTIPMDKGEVMYLVENKNDAIQQLIRQHHVEILTNDTEHGLLLRGTKQSLQVCETHVTELAENIVQCRHVIDKPGMPKYYISQRGKGYIESLEQKYKATILIDNEDTPVSSASGLQTTVLSVDCKQPIVNSSCTLPNGTKVIVVKGDITGYKVDVIVNEANMELKHTDGIAKAIVDKGGKAIQKECTKFIASKGQLAPGNIFISKAGELHCKQIVHAVGPKWQGGSQSEGNLIYEAVHKSLEAVNIAKHRTVGIPAIGAGVFGVPVDVACRNTIEAVSDFCMEGRHGIREVHLIDLNPTVVDAFRDTLYKHCVKDNIQLDSAQATAVSSYWRKTCNNTLQSPEGISLTTVEGQIANNTAEVIVNTTSEDLNLSKGGVSASILNAAGPSIETECQQYIKSHGVITHGDVVETSGGQIRTCKKIYHGSLQGWSDIKNDLVIRKFVQNCLRRAHNAGMVSIAMPAIGTGNLKYPHHVVASAMYDEVKTFSTSHPSTKLKDIRFVVLDKQTVASFVAEKNKQEQQMCTSRIGETGTKRKLVKHGLKSVQSKLDVTLLSETMEQYGSQLVIHDRVRIQVLKGDITTETCDAIVNSADDKLSMDSQVSKAIVSKGGQAILDEVQTVKPIFDGVYITTAGALPCKAIIHVVMTMENRICEKRIKSALQLASENKLSSIAFPALGTGTLGKGTTAMADMLVQAILDFCRKESTSSIELIKMVIFQEDMVVIYQQRLQMLAKCGKGVLQKLLPRRFVDKGEVFETDALKAFVHPRRMTFRIYAESDSTVTEITKSIDATCKDESKEFVLDGEKDQDIIKNLTEEQIEAIKRFETSHDVTISKEKIGRINRIVIGGRMQDILDVVQEINKLFREIENAEGLHKHVQWMFDEGNGFEAYPLYINAVIEGAFQRNEPDVIFKDETGIDEQMLCRISFHENIEIRNGITKQSYPVKRISRELPKHWDTMDKGEKYKTVCLRDVSPEYQQVEKEFRSSMASKEIVLNSIISVQWMLDEGTGFEPYPPVISAIIEKAFQKKEPRVEFTEETETYELRTRRINFSENKEVRNGDPKQTYSVKRNSKESCEPPKHWDPMGKEVYKTVQLPSGFAEYKEVEQKFKTSISSGGNAVKSIISITRIQNPNLYQRYCVHLEHMEKCNPTQVKNELVLWHGTADGVLHEIHANGFNRGFCGKNGTLYGKGVYFAASASFSNRYAVPNSSGHKHMYVCRVLVGETTKGNPELIVPPAKNPAEPAIKYDSVVDNETNPKIYAIFFDTQAYPEYLIKYT